MELKLLASAYFNKYNDIAESKELTWVISKEHIDHVPLYFNDAGQLCAISDYDGLLAEGSNKEYILEDFELSPYYETEAQVNEAGN